jgi:hypothetical protein
MIKNKEDGEKLFNKILSDIDDDLEIKTEMPPHQE